MLKTRFINLICSLLIVAAVFCLFDLAPTFSVSADTVDSVEAIEEEIKEKEAKENPQEESEKKEENQQAFEKSPIF